MTTTPEQLRTHVRDNLTAVVERINHALRGEDLEAIEPVLERIGRGGVLPHWYPQLKAHHTLPNLDGKTVGSVVEMILVGVLEKHFFAGMGIAPLRVNPARGVDLPDLDLGVKAPSTNFCTSEPFFTAYERLYGSDHDAVVLLTDYQEGKSKPPLRLQIKAAAYLRASEIADMGLCALARAHRDWLLAEDENRVKRLFRFLAFVNQSDFRAKRLVEMVAVMRDDHAVDAIIERSGTQFSRMNADRDIPIPDSDLEALTRVGTVTPRYVGVLDALDNWVIETWKDAGRAPNDTEWAMLLRSPLNGRLSLSFALQWRYNFGPLFNGEAKTRKGR